MIKVSLHEVVPSHSQDPSRPQSEDLVGSSFLCRSSSPARDIARPEDDLEEMKREVRKELSPVILALGQTTPRPSALLSSGVRITTWMSLRALRASW